MDQPLKAVHDTSVVRTILRLSNPETHWLFPYWQRQAVRPIVNRVTVAELRYHFVKRSTPHIGEAKRRAEQTIKPYLALSLELPYQAIPEAPRCQDPNDQKFLDLAYYSGSRYLVTEDKALLELADQVPFSILTTHHFRATLQELFPNP